MKLADICSIDVTEEQRFFLDEVNDFNLMTRYPDYKMDFYKLCTREYAEKYFGKIKEQYAWLKSQIE